MNVIKNMIIRKIVRKTILGSDAIYEFLWQCNNEEIEKYNKEVLNIKNKTGIETFKEYEKLPLEVKVCIQKS